MRKKGETPKIRNELPATPKKKINTRRKGHREEVVWARKFREELGFSHCKTTREASRMLDSCKVDLAFIPYNVQIKRGYARVRPKAEQVFKSMDEEFAKKYPPGDPQVKYPKILVHSIDGQHRYHTLVTMCAEDWIELVRRAEKIDRKEDGDE